MAYILFLIRQKEITFNIFFAAYLREEKFQSSAISRKLQRTHFLIFNFKRYKRPYHVIVPLQGSSLRRIEVT